MAETREKKATQALTVDYDRNADVLYMALGKPKAAVTAGRDDGVMLRYAFKDGSHCGVTVVGFRGHDWPQRLAVLGGVVGRHLGIKGDVVTAAIRKVDTRLSNQTDCDPAEWPFANDRQASARKRKRAASVRRAILNPAP